MREPAKPQPAACAEGQQECRRENDQDSEKQVVNQKPARVEMLDAHEMEVEPQTHKRGQHRQQDQQESFFLAGEVFRISCIIPPRHEMQKNS
jgi:hypothetical protein